MGNIPIGVCSISMALEGGAFVKSSIFILIVGGVRQNVGHLDEKPNDDDIHKALYTVIPWRKKL